MSSKSKSNCRKLKKNMKGGDPMSLDTNLQNFYEIEYPAPVDFNSGCQNNTSIKMTPQSIPLYTTTSPDWHEPKQPSPLAVDLDVGINEYTFGRTTPDNKFVIATGLVNNPQGVEMVGGKKSSDKKKKVKKSSDKKDKVKKSEKSIINKVVSGSKNLYEKTKKAIMGNTSTKKTKVKTEKKVKKDVKTKSFFNKISSGTKNIYEKLKKTIVGNEKKIVKKSKISKKKTAKSTKSTKSIKKEKSGKSGKK